LEAVKGKKTKESLQQQKAVGQNGSDKSWFVGGEARQSNWKEII
jgi:hypothetical protein